MGDAELHGYDYGAVARSPVTWDQFEDLKRVVGFTDRDQQLLSRAGELIGPRLEALLDHWFGQLGPWVHATFSGPDMERYSAAAGARFGRGVLDGFMRTYDQEWLDYQHEVGLRHARAKKNKTDRVDSVAVVPFRHLVASIQVLSEIPDEFLQGLSSADAAGIRGAWSKSLLLQVALWSRSYIAAEDW
jgi:Protoglobin